MKRVRLIHWNEEESRERAARLRTLGYQVDARLFEGPGSLRALRTRPPAAVVIDLGRLPSHGREIGITLRVTKSTRSIPLIYIEGAPGKVTRVQAALPDAVYTSWARIGPVLARAIESPLTSPVVPESTLAGYSGVPLVKKLGIKPGSITVLAGAPDDFEALLGELPPGAVLVRRAHPRRDMTIWFARSRAELERRIEAMASLEDGESLWIAWPKKASGVATDLSEQAVRTAGLAAGLVDFKISAIDTTWAGLKFVRRKPAAR